MKTLFYSLLLFAVLVAVAGSPYNRVRRAPQFAGVNTLPFYFNNPSTWSSSFGNSINNLFRPQVYSPGFTGYRPSIYTPSYGYYNNNGYRPFYSSSTP
uniref:Uncharacterized protein n=1 Tax=Daphnia galeata TaxID=27404 RepID=A0A8J2WP14_9CRUS|nr:unnamed protein product [Daphnia galeata]